MVMRMHKVRFLSRLRFLAALFDCARTTTICLLLSVTGCGRQQIATITFSKVPPASDGGSKALDTISGHVTGALPGQQIVIFSKTKSWWIQPSRLDPYTAIQADGSWSSYIHLGRQYAALLVNKKHELPPIVSTLPKTGEGVIAVAVVDGERGEASLHLAVPKTIRFSGYDWNVRSVEGNRGGIQRQYDTENVWLDAQGLMHLKATRSGDGWICSEVNLNRSLGYGTYRFQIRNIAHLEPAANLSLFTWLEDSPDNDHHELDINIGQRGDRENKNVEYVMQPYYVASNVYRFEAPAGPVTYAFDWEPESVSFEAWRGVSRPNSSQRISEHTFVSNIPPVGGETAHMNLCPFGFPKVALQRDAEVVIERFQYLP